MTMLETVRTEEAYRALASDALDRELARAADALKEGLTVAVSTKAAARYLGRHIDTLGEWRRRSPPLGPPYEKGAGAPGAGANEHVRYPFDELVAWRENRTNKTSKERRLLDELARIRQQSRELELELELAEAKAAMARLTKKKSRVLALDTLHDATGLQHEWALVGGRIAGHVLTVPDAVLAAALEQGDVWDATLADALQAPWTHENDRAPFAQVFQDALRDAGTQAEAARTRQRALDLEETLPDANKWRPDRVLKRL